MANEAARVEVDQPAGFDRASETALPPPVNRRGVLTAAFTGVAGIAVGAVLGRKFQVAQYASMAEGRGLTSPLERFREDARKEFLEEAQRIGERHRRQTARQVADLKSRYEKPVLGRKSVWELIESLARCVDPTDSHLGGASQLLHVQQALAAMEQHAVADPDLFLIGLLHDLGKVVLLSGEVPENVVCQAGRIGDFPNGVGLDNMVYQFGHGELIYSRVKDIVPDHIAWTVRYHNIDLADAAPFMDARDRAHAEKYLRPFRTFDSGFKSPHWVPKIDMARYRELVHDFFPKPILF